MIPVVTPDQMRRIDRAAAESQRQLIDRAGWQVAAAARRMLGGSYGRRVTVLAGRGNNGADGRVAAEVLRRWGMRCEVLAAEELPARWSSSTSRDLVIDACYGTGFRGEFHAPDVGDVPVLAVDIPSGVDGLSGAVSGSALRAQLTVTFVAPKPGLLLGPGALFVGDLQVADIGLPTSPPGEQGTRWWFQESDAATMWPRRATEAHKWSGAVWVVGGSPGMTGAPQLAALGAARAGAGYVRWSVPGSDAIGSHLVPEAVGYRLSEPDWADTVLASADRFGALLLGPGLSLDERTMYNTARLIERWPGPLVVDASGLAVLGAGASTSAATSAALAGRRVPAVLTPHDGEFVRIGGSLGDRLSGAEELSARLGSVVLLKGPTTLVAEPRGFTWFCTSGDERLATAGSGDVLGGVIAAALAMGMSPGSAAAAGATVHGVAGRAGPPVGLLAGDLPALVSTVLSRLVR